MSIERVQQQARFVSCLAYPNLTTGCARLCYGPEGAHSSDGSMMAIALEPGDSWQGISAKVTSFKSNSRWHRQMSRIVSSTAASMPDWYSELGSFAGFHLNTSLHTLLTYNKLRTLCRSSIAAAQNDVYREYRTFHSGFECVTRITLTASILLIWAADKLLTRSICQDEAG